MEVGFLETNHVSSEKVLHHEDTFSEGCGTPVDKDYEKSTGHYIEDNRSKDRNCTMEQYQSCDSASHTLVPDDCSSAPVGDTKSTTTSPTVFHNNSPSPLTETSDPPFVGLGAVTGSEDHACLEDDFSCFTSNLNHTIELNDKTKYIVKVDNAECKLDDEPDNCSSVGSLQSENQNYQNEISVSQEKKSYQNSSGDENKLTVSFEFKNMLTPEVIQSSGLNSFTEKDKIIESTKPEYTTGSIDDEEEFHVKSQADKSFSDCMKERGCVFGRDSPLREDKTATSISLVGITSTGKELDTEIAPTEEIKITDGGEGSENSNLQVRNTSEDGEPVCDYPVNKTLRKTTLSNTDTKQTVKENNELKLNFDQLITKEISGEISVEQRTATVSISLQNAAQETESRSLNGMESELPTNHADIEEPMSSSESESEIDRADLQEARSGSKSESKINLAHFGEPKSGWKCDTEMEHVDLEEPRSGWKSESEIKHVNLEGPRSGWKSESEIDHSDFEKSVDGKENALKINKPDPEEPTTGEESESKISKADLEEPMNGAESEWKIAEADLERPMTGVESESKTDESDLDESMNGVESESKITEAYLKVSTNGMESESKITEADLEESTNGVESESKITEADLEESTNGVESESKITEADLEESTNEIDLQESMNVVESESKITEVDLVESTNSLESESKITEADLEEAMNGVESESKTDESDLQKPKNGMESEPKIDQADLEETYELSNDDNLELRNKDKLLGELVIQKSVLLESKLQNTSAPENLSSATVETNNKEDMSNTRNCHWCEDVLTQSEMCIQTPDKLTATTGEGEAKENLKYIIKGIHLT
jgi:hypothetical protein